MLKKVLSTFKSLFKSSGQSTPPSKSVHVDRSGPAAGPKPEAPKPRQSHAPQQHGRGRKETREEYAARHARRTGAPGHAPHPARSAEQWDASTFQVPPAEGKTRFHDFPLVPEVMHAIADLGFQYCTPVQAETIRPSLNSDDIVAQAQTGTGKTAAFLITIFQRFIQHPVLGERPRGTPRALVLAPTRELVMQITKDARGLGKYVPCGILALLGGIDYAKQQTALRNDPCDLLICTPGRLIDFKRKGLVDLSKVEILVLDEADRMLDMGFIDAVRSIVMSTPPKSDRQTMFFSATMSGDVRRLADSWTRHAVEVSIMPESVAVDTVDQITYITTQREKPILLYNLIQQKHLERVLIFANRKDEARELRDTMVSRGVQCALLSGDVDQRQRMQRLERFREGKVRVLVATNVASRGLHIEGISHVINYNMPLDVEEYVHRIGRTGRAGATGTSISFADEYDSYEIDKLETFLGRKIPCTYPEPYLLEPIPEIPAGQAVPPPQDDGPAPQSHRARRRPRRR